MKKKVLIGPSSFSAIDRSPLENLLAAGFEVIDNPFKRKITQEELVDLLPGVHGLIAGLETLDRDVMESSDLKVISRCGSGMSNVDQEAARELGIKVYCTPDGPTNSVAELTVGMLISLIRLVPPMDTALHNNMWDKKIGFELGGKTLLIIGFGRIGRRVSELLQPFHVNIIVYDPFLDPANDATKVLPLDSALEQADIITIHASGEDVILGEKEFFMMKEGVFLLNGARGGLIDEDCLVHNLGNGRVAGAWLDSYGREPYEGPLTRFPQAILTPHVGSYTQECRKRMETEAAENLIAGFAGERDRL